MKAKQKLLKKKKKTYKLGLILFKNYVRNRFY